MGAMMTRDHVHDAADIHRHEELDHVLVRRELLLEREELVLLVDLLPQLQLRDVGLQEDVHLGARLIDALLDGEGHMLHQLGKLQLLLVPDTDVPELAGECEHPEQFDLRQLGLQQLVVGVHGVAGDVVVGQDPPELRGLEVARLPVVLDEVGLLALLGGGV